MSPQSALRALGGNGYAFLQGDNIEWNLPDGKLVDIPIDRETNLPLIRDFVCLQKEKEAHIRQKEEQAGVNAVPALLEEPGGASEDDRPDYEQFWSLQFNANCID